MDNADSEVRRLALSEPMEETGLGLQRSFCRENDVLEQTGRKRSSVFLKVGAGRGLVKVKEFTRNQWRRRCSGAEGHRQLRARDVEVMRVEVRELKNGKDPHAVNRYSH